MASGPDRSLESREGPVEVNAQGHNGWDGSSGGILAHEMAVAYMTIIVCRLTADAVA
jgi:hypothetical protein